MYRVAKLLHADQYGSMEKHGTQSNAAAFEKHTNVKKSTILLQRPNLAIVVNVRGERADYGIVDEDRFQLVRIRHDCHATLV